MKKRIFALFLSITLLVSAVVTPVSAEAVKDFTVKVCDVTANAGDSQVAVDIVLENNPGISGFSFCVDYDTEKLVLAESKINIESGYQVVTQPTGYGVNFAWTDSSVYTEDGKIATLYFNIPKELTAGEANIDIVYRAGYDSFYDSDEQDITIQTVNGKITIEALQETDKPSVNIGGVSVNFGDTDIVVPISVKNNPGFSGFSFCVNFDTSRLILTDADILIDGGYEVIGYPDGYGVNIAWTGTEPYTADGNIAELHFSLTTAPNSGKAYINTAFRIGYDSFYIFENGTEQDIEFGAYSGYVDISNHVFGEWVITESATCTATGLKTRTCIGCSKIETVVIPKISHEYIAVVTPPTCTASGYTTHTCKMCQTYYIDSYVDVVDHTLGEWEETIAPECEVNGEEIQKCTVCKSTINTREIVATGHDFGDWYTVSEATFNEDGQRRRDCEKCDHYEVNRLPKLSENHVCSFTGIEEVTSESTCTESGSKKVYCNVPECGEYSTVSIEPKGHTEGEWTITQNATCTETGTKDLLCAVCNQVLETETIEATGHQYGSWIITKQPTSTAAGEKIRVCSVCYNVEKSTISPTAKLPKIVVTGDRGCVGSTVKVNISLEDNPGITAAKLKVVYDSTKLQLISIDDTGILNGSTFSEDLMANPYILCWEDSSATSDNNANGEIVTLSFKVLQSEMCTTDIILTFDEEDISNINGDLIFFDTQKGQIEIAEPVLGDINCDGTCNIGDAAVMHNGILGFINFDDYQVTAADMNNDGKHNILDLMMLLNSI